MEEDPDTGSGRSEEWKKELINLIITQAKSLLRQVVPGTLSMRITANAAETNRNK